MVLNRFKKYFFRLFSFLAIFVKKTRFWPFQVKNRLCCQKNFLSFYKALYYKTFELSLSTVSQLVSDLSSIKPKIKNFGHLWVEKKLKKKIHHRFENFKLSLSTAPLIVFELFKSEQNRPSPPSSPITICIVWCPGLQKKFYFRGSSIFSDFFIIPWVGITAISGGSESGVDILDDFW